MAQIFANSQQIVGDNNLADTGVIGWVLTWGPFGTSDTLMPVEKYGGYADKTFQVEGTFDGTSVALTGSNDGENFHALSDPTGSTIAISAAGLKEVMEQTLFLVPALTGGDVSTSITATLFVRKTQSK